MNRMPPLTQLPPQLLHLLLALAAFITIAHITVTSYCTEPTCQGRRERICPYAEINNYSLCEYPLLIDENTYACVSEENCTEPRKQTYLDKIRCKNVSNMFHIDSYYPNSRDCIKTDSSPMEVIDTYPTTSCICLNGRFRHVRKNGIVECVFPHECNDQWPRTSCNEDEYETLVELEPICDTSPGIGFSRPIEHSIKERKFCRCDRRRNFIRNSKGNCVKWYDCNPRLASLLCLKHNNEHYSWKQLCRPSCDDKTKAICSKTHVDGNGRFLFCNCNKGYSWNSTRHCVRCDESRVPEENCFKEDHKHLSDYAKCEPLCDDKSVRRCSKAFITATGNTLYCNCNRGYSLHSNGSCVPCPKPVAKADERPEDCRDGEYIAEEASESFCDNVTALYHPKPLVWSRKLRYCLCDHFSGFSRHSSGACVNTIECSEQYLSENADCNDHEAVFTRTSSHVNEVKCEPACNPPSGIWCSNGSITHSNVVYFCVCDTRRGYMRQSNGTCLRRTSCD